MLINKNKEDRKLNICKRINLNKINEFIKNHLIKSLNLIEIKPEKYQLNYLRNKSDDNKLLHKNEDNNDLNKNLFNINSKKFQLKNKTLKTENKKLKKTIRLSLIHI